MNASHPAPDQTDLFTAGEADAWYYRNQAHLESNSRSYVVDEIIEVLGPFKPEINSILEIGCGIGVKLEQLAEFFAAKGEGIEPSALAVSDGNDRLHRSGSSVKLAVGIADKLPYGSAQFDLVYFGFCLCVVSRERLFSSLTEADRVLKSGGFLSIADFDPSVMHKRDYHHKSGLFTYKNRYEELFTASGHYHLVSKRSFSHGGRTFVKDSNERLSLTVLYKEPDPYPLRRSGSDQ
jgi:ubiquinone/menaquinone biosynthesis C-methylase UbiE